MSGRDRTADGSAEVTPAPSARGRLLPELAGFAHVALLYDGDQDLGRAVAIVRQAAGSDAPLHVAVPGRTMRLAREALGLTPRTALMSDMAELGRNPARIIPAAQSFGDEHPGRHIYCLWEPAWPERSAAEMHEVARHEALCNLAFSGREMTVFCLYDSSRLSPGVVSDAERTHPVVVAPGRHLASTSYLGPGRLTARV